MNKKILTIILAIMLLGTIVAVTISNKTIDLTKDQQTKAVELEMDNSDYYDYQVGDVYVRQMSYGEKITARNETELDTKMNEDYINKLDVAIVRDTRDTTKTQEGEISTTIKK